MPFTAATPGGVLTATTATMLALPRLFRLSQGRTGRHLVVRFEPADVFPGNVALDQLLDPVELLDLVGANQREGLPGGPGPIGPPGYCQFCDALALQANRGSNLKKGP